MRIEFTVIGRPQAQGSMKAFYNKKARRAIVTSDNGNLQPWRQDVALAAIREMREQKAKRVERPQPVRLDLKFYFRQPAGRKKQPLPSVRPDGDKLERAICDALSGIAFDDDAQVCEVHKWKLYGLPERVEIVVHG